MSAPVNQIGFWSGVVAGSMTVMYVIVQLLQIAGALHFPLDEILIFGTSLGIVMPFLLEILALHYLTAHDLRFWTHAALIFATIYAVFVTSNYVVQLTTVIPARLVGSTESLHILEQTPHSLFWDYDAAGYVFMGLAALFAVPAVGRRDLERWVRRFMLLSGVVTPLIGIVYFYPTFSVKLLLVAGLPWAIVTPLFMFLLAVMLRRKTPDRVL